MMIPKIHLNGTSKEELLSQVTDAGQAVSQAMRALTVAWPNARDYYPQGPDALREAEVEWRSRIERLKSVYNELSELAESIADQG
jgi:hypothetical protein